ncbi:MAG: hypothetical protein QOI71_2791 [Gaiellales bacterium]|nr:hypothetical protein [Gaiellales bacterium]
MKREIQGQIRLIDASGLGLLPGIGLAMVIALIAVLAIVAESWWITFVAAGAVIAVAAAVTMVVLRIADDDADAEPHA